MEIKTRLMTLSLLAALTLSASAVADSNPEAADIVARCNYKDPGDDQRSRLTVILRDKGGDERKNVYLRLWKDYEGGDGIDEKMLLFTEYPPDAEGAAFMRWGYTHESNKNAEQWIYLPVLRKIRRVTIRDPGSSFLGSDLTHADISGRALEEDEHRLLKTDQQDNATFYTVESVPKESDPLYGKRLQLFAKGDSWDDCARVGVAYYDRKQELLKRQRIKWQRVEGAWVWDEVKVENVQTQHVSVFRVSDVEINVGLEDDLFTERTLRRGP